MRQKIILTLAITAILAGCKKNPSASFSTSKSNYYLNETVSVNNNATNASSYSWDFGDGSSSTEKNPQHTYTVKGTYQIKLTVNGSSSITKAVKIYPGTASYEVQNNSSGAVPLVSFAANANNDIIDFVDHGNVLANGKTDTVFTNNANIILGGQVNGKVFIVVNPYPMKQFSHNVVALTNQSQIYLSNNSVSGYKSIQSLNLNKANPEKFQNIQ